MSDATIGRNVGRRVIDRLGWLAAVIGGTAMASPAWAMEFGYAPRAGQIVQAVPPQPTTYSAPFVLDDNQQEGAFGVTSGLGASQFLWFNRFSTPGGSPVRLEQVWVLFPSGANMAVGNAVQIVMYSDADGNPANGASLLANFDTTIQAADGNTFSVYNLATPIELPTGADLLVGAVPRFITTGQTSPTNPAAIDTTATRGRSWVAIWSADPPNPPVLPPDALIAPIDTLRPGGGNWMIRAFGTQLPPAPVPAANTWALVLLAGVIVLAGMGASRRVRAAREAD